MKLTDLAIRRKSQQQQYTNSIGEYTTDGTGRVSQYIGDTDIIASFRVRQLHVAVLASSYSLFAKCVGDVKLYY